MGGFQTICTKCKKSPAIFFRKYSGEKLCKKCFLESVENRVKGTISRFKMFREEDRIAVGVSGGKDSVALLYILSKIERKFPKSELIAITIDEGIKGYREESLRIARKVAKDLDVEHVVFSFKDLFGYTLDSIFEHSLKKEIKLAPCTYCGVLRRKALNLAAREVNASKLATAHNLDDEAQTILINFLRGDVERLARLEPVQSIVHPKFVPRVKPLMEVPENEVSLYVYLRELDFFSAPCPYARYSLRGDIRDFLNKMEEKRPGTKFIVLNTHLKLLPFLKQALREKVSLQECIICGEPTPHKICKACELLQGIQN
ncbi:MAG: TIGR00269 family protein [Candidatus Baldrarchaeia archaeon]